VFEEHDMKVFISLVWREVTRGGNRPQSALQDVNQRIIAWLSDADIKAGDRWGSEPASHLESSNFGIIYVTQESLQSPWILFEAGALGKVVSGSCLGSA
jgi:hypothetical protein